MVTLKVIGLWGLGLLLGAMLTGAIKLCLDGYPPLPGFVDCLLAGLPGGMVAHAIGDQGAEWRRARGGQA